LYVPAAQAVALALPTGQKLPSPHVMQSSWFFITSSDAFVRVPAGQGSGAAAPSLQ
jgi:hypothetical protein